MQQLFDELIDDPPASTVDVNAIVARERRARRQRRLAGIGTAVAAVAVLGLLVGTDVITRKVPGPFEAGAPGPVKEDPAYTEYRLTNALRSAMAREAPLVVLSNVEEFQPDAPLKVRYEPCGVATHPVRPLPKIFSTSAGVSRDNHRGVFMFESGYRVADSFCAKAIASPPGTESPGPAGERVFTRWRADDSGASVFVVRPDGTFVNVYVTWLTSPSGDPPLTLAQLTAIALDPALAL
jgi:hypothetical protein